MTVIHKFSNANRRLIIHLRCHRAYTVCITHVSVFRYLESSRVGISFILRFYSFLKFDFPKQGNTQALNLIVAVKNSLTQLLFMLEPTVLCPTP